MQGPFNITQDMVNAVEYFSPKLLELFGGLNEFMKLPRVDVESPGFISIEEFKGHPIVRGDNFIALCIQKNADNKPSSYFPYVIMKRGIKETEKHKWKLPEIEWDMVIGIINEPGWSMGVKQGFTRYTESVLFDDFVYNYVSRLLNHQPCGLLEKESAIKTSELTTLLNNGNSVLELANFEQFKLSEENHSSNKIKFK